MKHKTPTWLDLYMERKEITLEEFLEKIGMTNAEFWQLFFELELSEENPDPALLDILLEESTSEVASQTTLDFG